ncbi:unnamed protein product [Cylindrotheca closterium]|uniref:Uncharacterized protein n=1 Tax=Cylindrotheca closterium TaxID=2856 RepID=A0AAD2FI93_9STRA|nr:unnamed protein product [Cylindrotheca closterium]
MTKASKVPMWITQDETLSDLSTVHEDTKVSNLRFVYVDFTDEVLERLQDLSSREFETICLFSCRGKMDAAISFFLGQMRIREFVVNTFIPDSFDDSAAMALGKGLEVTTTLKRLHLHGCLASRQFPDALRHGLENCPSLEHLEFNLAQKIDRSGNRVGRVLAEVLPKIPNLNKLVLRKNQLDSRQLLMLLKGLVTHTLIKELEMAIPCLDKKMVVRLRQLAESPQNNIERLNLLIDDHHFNLHKLSSEGSCSYCITPKMADPQDMDYLGRVAVANTKITGMDLSFLASKEDDLILSIAPWIARMRGLKYLNIEGFRLQPEGGGEEFVMAMISNTSIEQVILSSGCVYASWITHFADLNKGGRRLLEADDVESLWPLVLSKACKATYTGGKESIPQENRRANVVYDLLRSQAGLLGANM